MNELTFAYKNLLVVRYGYKVFFNSLYLKSFSIIKYIMEKLVENIINKYIVVSKMEKLTKSIIYYIVQRCPTKMYN